MAKGSGSESEGEKTAKRRARGVMLHSTAVARQLRNGAIGVIQNEAERGQVRITQGAVEEAVKATERMFKELGEACHHSLKTANKKTVSKDLILDILQEKCYFRSAVEAVKGASDSGARKGANATRQPIAIASVMKCFGKGINLGKGAYRVSDKAKYALAALALAYVHQLGSRSATYANAGKRSTISSTDVGSAVKSLIH